MTVTVTVLIPVTRFVEPETRLVAFTSFVTASTVTALVRGATSINWPGFKVTPFTFKDESVASFEKPGPTFVT